MWIPTQKVLGFPVPSSLFGDHYNIDSATSHPKSIPHRTKRCAPVTVDGGERRSVLFRRESSGRAFGARARQAATLGNPPDGGWASDIGRKIEI